MTTTNGSITNGDDDLEMKQSLPPPAAAVTVNENGEETRIQLPASHSSSSFASTTTGNTKSSKSSRPPIQLEWKDLHFEVKVRADPPDNASFPTRIRYLFKKEKRTILFPMSGHVAPGQCLAIMGPSGAGKTSLLNILAQRVKAKGEITVNGQNVGKSFRSLSAFVQQDDVLMANLTVREALRYAALLRLGSDIPLKEKARRVLAVAEELGLTKCLDTYIGAPGVKKGISGGERKRLAIAIELLSEPSLLFLDEPTSGLDARTALDVIKAIRKLAEGGRAVIMTIHQPRSNIYKLFDKLALLARGRVAYFGDAQLASSYFAKIPSLDPENKPGMFKCPSDFNPSDFFIDLVTESTSASPEERKLDNARINYVLDYYQNNYVYQKPEIDSKLNSNLSKYGSYSSNWFVQLGVLTFRSFVNIIRDKMLTTARMMQTLIMSIVIGLIFLRLGQGQSNVQDKIGVIFFILAFTVMGGMFSSVTAFISSEKAVFMRERGAKTYRVSSYYLAKVLAELPSNFVFPVLLGTIAYWMVGLNPSAAAFFTFLLITVFISCTAQSLGMLIAAISPSMEAAQAMAPVVITMFMLFGGFYIKVSNIPPWFIWIYWMSMFHFGYEAYTINEFRGTKYNCPPAPQVCQYPDGDAVIRNLGMTGRLSNIWINLGFLACVFVVCRTLTYFILLAKKPKGG